MSFWQTIKAAAVKSTVSEMRILENGKKIRRQETHT